MRIKWLCKRIFSPTQFLSLNPIDSFPHQHSRHWAVKMCPPLIWRRWVMDKAQRVGCQGLHFWELCYATHDSIRIIQSHRKDIHCHSLYLYCNNYNHMEIYGKRSFGKACCVMCFNTGRFKIKKALKNTWSTLNISQFHIWSIIAADNIFGRSWSVASVDKQHKRAQKLKCSIKKAQRLPESTRSRD